MNKPDLTISDVASELRIRRESAVTLILSGALQGYDVTPPGAKRKTFRVTRQALDDFKSGRSAKQTKSPRRKFVAKQPADFVEYFR